MNMQDEREATSTQPIEEANAADPTRRSFMQGAALGAAALMIVPRHVLGGPAHTAPSDLVNVAAIGVGGIGRANLAALSTQNLVALCDVDWRYVATRYGQIPEQIREMADRIQKSTSPEESSRLQAQIENLQRLEAKAKEAHRYTDFREMLEKQDDIDAVVIGTPDHTHAVIALAAMSLGKHVYLQKP